jgi:hypothetical protein
MTALDSLSADIIALPKEVANEASGAMDLLRTELQTQYTIGPSTISMLDSAKEKMDSASRSYDISATDFRTKTLGEIESAISSSRLIYLEAIDLITRARESRDELGELMRLILIFGPIVLIGALLLYFRMQFRGSLIETSISTDHAPAAKESEITRSLTITNPERNTVKMVLKESFPGALKSGSFDVKPTSRQKNSLVWEFDLGPKDKFPISYKLKVPALSAGWTLTFPAPSLRYSIAGRQKTFMGSSTELKIK